MPAAPHGDTEGRARGINGVPSRGRSPSEPPSCPQPLTLDITITPAVRRIWTAGLLAISALFLLSLQPALAQMQVAVVTEPTGANLRGGPGTGYESLGVIPDGSELPVLGPITNDVWVPVSYRGTRGFVRGDLVEIRAVLAPANPSAAASNSSAAVQMAMASPAPTSSNSYPQQLRVNSPEGLNLRAAAGTDARVLTLMVHNSRVTATGRSADGKWVAITFDGQYGWADSQYLAPDDGRPLPSGGGADGNPAAASGTARYIWPVAGRSITTYFGPSHVAIDVDQYPVGGNPIVSTAAGKVIFSGGNPCCSYGLYVKVEHPDGAMSLYAHMQSLSVREGQEVAQGDTLGLSGNTGFSTGAHIHFELHLNGSPADPLMYLGRGPAIASPTPSPRPSASPQPSPSASPSASPSPSASASPSASPSSSATPSPSATPQPSASPQPALPAPPAVTPLPTVAPLVTPRPSTAP